MGLSLQSQAAGWPYLGFKLVKHGCYHAISQKEPGCSQRSLVLLIMSCGWGESGGPWVDYRKSTEEAKDPGARPGAILEWAVLECTASLPPSTPCRGSAAGDRG